MTQTRRATNTTVRGPAEAAARRRGSAATGFTLIETTLAIIIVGVGVLAIVAAQQAYHVKNDYALRTGTAQQLAQEVRELMAGLPHHDPHVSGSYGLDAGETAGNLADYDDLDDFAGTVDVTGFGDGASFAPPIAADGSTITELTQWSQRVTVDKVLVTDINTSGLGPFPLNYTGDPTMMRVTVEVYYQDPNEASPDLITKLTWVEP